MNKILGLLLILLLITNCSLDKKSGLWSNTSKIDIEKDLIITELFEDEKTFSEELNSNLKILLGGQHFTIMGEKAFHRCFDYAYTGECENQLIPLLEKIENNQSFNSIKGLYYRTKNSKVKFTGMNTYIRDLDS